MKHRKRKNPIEEGFLIKTERIRNEQQQEKKLNGIRRVAVELGENVMMNENKAHMSCLSAGDLYDRQAEKEESFQFSCLLFYRDIPLFKGRYY